VGRVKLGDLLVFIHMVCAWVGKRTKEGKWKSMNWLPQIVLVSEFILREVCMYVCTCVCIVHSAPELGGEKFSFFAFFVFFVCLFVFVFVFQGRVSL
jgi:hypothetical protein